MAVTLKKSTFVPKQASDIAAGDHILNHGDVIDIGIVGVFRVLHYVGVKVDLRTGHIGSEIRSLTVHSTHLVAVGVE